MRADIEEMNNVVMQLKHNPQFVTTGRILWKTVIIKDSEI